MNTMVIDGDTQAALHCLPNGTIRLLARLLWRDWVARQQTHIENFMTEDRMDKLEIRLLAVTGGIAKWAALQGVLPIVLPCVLCLLPSGTVLFVALYTVLYNLCWEFAPVQRRLSWAFYTYAAYVLLALVCSAACLAEYSVWGIMLAPLYGLACFLVVKKYRVLWKKASCSLVKRAALLVGVCAAAVVLKTLSVLWACRGQGSFEGEKNEIVQRRNYLEAKLVASSPGKILSEMPPGIGEQFRGEWALYSCSMFSAALVNISRLYPETTAHNRQSVDSLIQRVLSPELRAYDTRRWGGDALQTLGSQASHISYISHLAWMIGGYKAIGGSGKYDGLYSSLCETMNRRIVQSPALNLPTYPGEPVYIPDMLVAIAALKQYSRQHGGQYGSTVKAWVERARAQWCDERTGLLVSFLNEDGTKMDGAPVKGSYSALNCYYLTLADAAFAREQYSCLKRHFWNPGVLSGFREYCGSSPVLALDMDAGPVVMGMSPSGTAFGIGSATFFGDSAVREGILRTAEVAGNTVQWRGKRHYALADAALVGEAVMLAMRTNVCRQ